MPTTPRLPAIPTLYKGVQYRSRLEARYAALWEAFGWEAEYEPIDLAGYLPDFVITRGHTDGVNVGEPLLVECKPFVDATNGDAQSAAEVATRIAKAWHGDALIACAAWHTETLPNRPTVALECGEFTFRPSTRPTTTRLRIGRIRLPAVWGATWHDAYIARDHVEGHGFDAHVDEVNAPYWRIATRHDPATEITTWDMRVAREAWAHAGNVVQWRKPAGGAQ